MENFSFEKLLVYKKARLLTKQVYLLVEKLPSFEKYALCEQLRRSIVSVVSNIAEQSGRNSHKEKCHFIEIAYGSLMESYSQLQLAVDLNYIKQEDLENLKPIFFQTAKLLSGLKRSFTHNP